MDNITLMLDQDTRDLVIGSNGDLQLLEGHDTTAQNVRNLLLTWRGDWPLDLRHGTDYNRVLGRPGTDNEEIKEILRDAIFQEADVHQVDSIALVREGGNLTVSFDGKLQNGEAIHLEEVRTE